MTEENGFGEKVSKKMPKRKAKRNPSLVFNKKLNINTQMFEPEAVQSHQDRKDTPEYPSIAQQAKNLMKTAVDVARDPRWVDDTEYERRMKLCRACNLYDKVQNRCKKCGCKLKGKARFKAGRCPIQKW